MKAEILIDEKEKAPLSKLEPGHWFLHSGNVFMKTTAFDEDGKRQCACVNDGYLVPFWDSTEVIPVKASVVVKPI